MQVASKICVRVKCCLSFVMLVWALGLPSVFLNITEGKKKGLHRTGKVNTDLEALPAGTVGPAPGRTRVGEEIGGRKVRPVSCICGFRNTPVLNAVRHLEEYTPHVH